LKFLPCRQRITFIRLMGFEVKKERLVLVILPLTGENHLKRLV